MQVFATCNAIAGGIAVAPQLTLKYRQAVRIMKLSSILLFVLCMQLGARGLTQTITLNVKDAPIQSVIKSIEKQTGYAFFYSVELLKQAKKITITVNSLPLQQVLDQVFRDQPLIYTIAGKNITISPKEIKKNTQENDQGMTSPIDVKGRVVNESEEPVTAASVSVKGTNRGTTTNDNGEFYLSGLEENAVLVISGVNINTTEIKVNGLSLLFINVKSSITPLEETIIKGYYTTTRKLNTGSVSKLTNEDIVKQPVNNPLAALAGRAAGVYIVQNSGVPGGSFALRLRGQNSILSGNDPLYIIDGVPFSSKPIGSVITSALITDGGNPLNSINPSDIESIEILKDADATSIYGSRGGNGVILITTKKGKAGKTSIGVELNGGIEKVAHFMKLLNTEQYLEMRKEAFKNDGATMNKSSARDILVWDTTHYTDWQKSLIGKTANFFGSQLSISGGNTNTKFLFSGNYKRQTTVFPGDFEYKKGAVHFNFENLSFDNKLRFSLVVTYSADKNILPNQDFTTQALFLPPNAPKLFDSLGNLNWENSTWINPLSYGQKRYKTNSSNLISSASINYRLLPGLNLKSSFGFNKIQADEIYTDPLYSNDPSNVAFFQASSRFANLVENSWIIEPQVDFSKSFKSFHLSFLAGGTFQQNIRTNEAFVASGFTNDVLIENLKAAPTFQVFEDNYNNYKYISLYARLNLNVADKYLLNITGRRDGSSRFGPNNQFANFGSIGAGWIFSKEKLFSRSLKILSYGKIRTSYGITGNDQIGDYGYYDLWSPMPYTYLGNAVLSPNSLLNKNYSWEKNKKFEVGVELGFLDNRFFVSADYYFNRTSSQLVGYSLPLITGFSSVQANLPASVQNSGFEIEVSTINFKKRNLAWKTSFNLTFPDNKLVSFPGLSSSPYANVYSEGKSLFIRKSYHFLGVDPNNGIYQFEDIDKDGAITYPKDLTEYKAIEQEYFGGLQNNFTWNNFQFDLFIQFVKQTGRNYFYTFSNAPGTRRNQPELVINRWSKPGDVSAIEKFTQSVSSAAYKSWSNAFNRGDNTITDASFVRVKNVSISYSLPIKRNTFENIKVYIQAQNVYTYTNHYVGLDPENQNGSFIPPLRTFQFGVKLSF